MSDELPPTPPETPASPPPEGEGPPRLKIEDELKESYLNYAMSVIISRALPDVRDGLKPSQRRILLAMHDLNLGPTSSTTKCAGIVGETMKRYHPHGDGAIYPTLVRMGQEWNMRHRLVHPQGNFGSIAGLPPAAMRYCVAGDTLVRTLNGTRRIADIAALKPDSETDLFLELFNRDGQPVVASKLFHSGSHPTFRVRTKEGFELAGTGNHPLLCLDRVEGRPELVWRLLDQVKPGDRVVMARWQDDADHEELRANDRHLMLLLGAMVAEGFVSENRAGFNNLDKDYFNLVLAAYDAVVGGARYVYQRVIKTGNLLHELDIHNLANLRLSPLVELLGVRSAQKRAPWLVWSACREAKRVFLQALFEGDGSSSLLARSTISISYSTCSVQLARDVQALLLEFGVVARQAVYDGGEIKVFISNRRDARRFAERVGFLGAKQRKLEAELAQVPQQIRTMSSDHVPFLADFVREQCGSRWNDRDWLNRHNIDRFERWEEQGDAIKSRIASPEVVAVVEPLVDGRYYYAEVASVEHAGVQPVYSLRVESDCHSFVTNGFISHNTEARLSHIAAEMLEDLERDTVDYIDNYDGKYREPLVLPSKFPNLIVNGSDGIAVGMATEIPPHNLGEVSNAVIRLIDEPDVSIDQLIEVIPGPDFPTGGIICGRQGIYDGYRTGRGKITLRARASINEEGARNQVIIHEVPYQQTRNRLAEAIGELVKEERIKGVSAMRDESSARSGEPVRIVLDLKRDADPELVLNQLYQYSPLQKTVSLILLALVDGRPKTLTIKQMLEEFLRHRVLVIRRRTDYLLREAKRRSHILEGQLIAISSLDEVIRVCRASPSRADAKIALQGLEVSAALMERALGDANFAALQKEIGTAASYFMTEQQAEAVVRMQLGQLAALERDEIFKEYATLRAQIRGYEGLLSDDANILAVIRHDMETIRDKYGEERRTEITGNEAGKMKPEELMAEETNAVTLSHNGYIKRLPLSTYRSQHRGGKGVSGGSTREDDFIEHFYVASSHAYLLCFTDWGQLYWIKVYDLPQMSRTSAGRAIANVLSLREGERISSVIPVRQFDPGWCLMLATRRGLVKKTSLDKYSRPKQGGIIGIALEEGDKLISVVLVRAGDEVVLCTKLGMAIRFGEADARPMGRDTYGVKGINLMPNDEVVGMVVADPAGSLLTLCENGYGKRTPFGPNTAGVDVPEGEDGEVVEPVAEAPPVEAEGEPAETRSGMRYRKQRRGGKGLRDIRTSERNGPVVGIVPVRDGDDIMLITSQGMVNRTHVSEIRTVGRNTQGVRIMNLNEADKIASLAKVASEDIEQSETAPPLAGEAAPPVEDAPPSE